MSEMICVVRRQGGTLRLIPEGDQRSNGDTIPKTLQRGLTNGQRVRVVRRPNGSIETITPLSDAVAPPASAPATRGRVGVRQRARTGYFANPYNFVPFSTAMRAVPDLAEGPAVSHDRAAEDSYSAKLVVTMKTVTPLLTMEQQGKDAHQPAVYSVRRDPVTHRPLIAGASVKGMLRSLYEQVTSSRLGIFNHTSPLSVRSVTDDARDTDIVRVVAHAPGRSISLLRQGTIQPRINPPAPVNTIVSVLEASVQGFDNGASVYAWLQLIEHHVGNHYCWWRVVGRVSTQPTPIPDAPDRPSAENHIVPGQPLIQVQATLHKTGHTISNKKAERLFVDKLISTGDATHGNDLLPVQTGAAYLRLVAGWREKLESFTGEAPPGVDRADYVLRPDRWAPLDVGQTMFLREHDGRIELYPGMITRESFARAPALLLGGELFPARRSDTLTAADRLFGWVPPERSTEPNRAHRGQLRVGAVTCLSECAAPSSADTWQLATLNSPKPSHARFYTRDTKGNPTHDRAKRDGYRATDQLAGHKVYPHQERRADYWQLPAGGWVSPTAEGGYFPKDSAGHFRNFLSAPMAAPSVSAKITDWVEPGVTFEVTIYLSNARGAELAALLWILTLSDDELVLKLGMGKPLGFGSVRVGVDWTRSTIRSTEQLREHLGRLEEGPAVDSETARSWATEFEAVLRTKVPDVFRSIIAAAHGTELVTHYPRQGNMTTESRPQAETYKWFVANERNHPKQHALPLLAPENRPESLPNDPLQKRGV